MMPHPLKENLGVRCVTLVLHLELIYEVSNMSTSCLIFIFEFWLYMFCYALIFTTIYVMLI
jgi:hypothetical protein